MPIRFEVHVRPNASRSDVGGDFDEALVARVVEPADRGRATEATLRAVAAALGVARSSVGLARDATSRRKLLAIDVEPDDVARVERAVTLLLERPAD